jgi:hypothetical protein
MVLGENAMAKNKLYQVQAKTEYGLRKDFFVAATNLFAAGGKAAEHTRQLEEEEPKAGTFEVTTISEMGVLVK